MMICKEEGALREDLKKEEEDKKAGADIDDELERARGERRDLEN
jgi:hypothetical protein